MQVETVPIGIGEKSKQEGTQETTACFDNLPEDTIMRVETVANGIGEKRKQEGMQEDTTYFDNLPKDTIMQVKTVPNGIGEKSKQDDTQEATTYFDKLPEDAVKNIIRFTSNRPRVETWMAYISKDVSRKLLTTIPALSECWSGHFLSLQVQKHPRRDSSSSLSIGLNTKNSLHYRTLVCDPRNISKEHGIAERILMEVLSPTSAKHYGHLTFVLPKLKRLSLWSLDLTFTFPIWEILSAHTATLEFLEIRKNRLSVEEIVGISKFGKQLKSFSLAVANVLPVANALWRSMGDSLESLSITWGYFDMRSIMNNCNRLQRLTFKSVEKIDAEIEDTCKKLGNQLRSLTFDQCAITSSRLHRIADACSSASLELFQNAGCTSSALHAMGTRACRVHLGTTTVKKKSGHNFQYLKEGAAQCANLVGISIEGEFGKAPFQAVFAHPKPLLLEFKGVFGGKYESEFVFTELASNVSSLKTFEFIGMLPSTAVLQDFVESNPSLKKVSVKSCGKNSRCREDAGPNGIQSDIGIAAKIFLQCQNLEELSVSCLQHFGGAMKREHIARQCLLARRKRLSVRICGYQYY